MDWTGTTLDPARDATIASTYRSLVDAREYVRQVATTKDGGHCPCCGQDVKVYRRTITSSMARALVVIYLHFRTRGFAPMYVHVPTLLAGQRTLPTRLKASWHGGDWSKLRYWDLLQPLVATREDGSNRVGYWAITKLGRDFVEGRATVLRHAFLYANTLLCLDGTRISIDDAFGEPFDLQSISEVTP